MFLFWKPEYSTYSLPVFSQNKTILNSELLPTTYFFYHASKGMDKTMETTHNIGKKTVCFGCTERTVVVSIVHYSFVCLMLCSDSVNTLQIMHSNSPYENTCQIFKENRMSVND